MAEDKSPAKKQKRPKQNEGGWSGTLSLMCINEGEDPSMSLTLTYTWNVRGEFGQQMDSALPARHKEAYNSGNNEDRSATEQIPRERFPSLWIGWR